MPRYYFHIRNDIDADDEEGAELPDIAAAREHALEGARDLVCQSVKHGHLNLDHYLEVASEDGTILFRLTFREAFEIEG